MLISVHDVSRTYPGADRPALASVSLQLRPGDVIAVIGHNGAGKSTLFDIAAGLARPDSGSVLTEVTPSEVGWCPQREIIDWSLTVRQNVALGLELRSGRRVPRADVDETLDLMGLAPFGDRQAETLSGGELRRTQIARALAGQPSVAILDEPTTGLDPEAVFRVFRHITDLASRGSGILLSTHETSRFAPFCTRVIALHRGCVVADMTVEQFMRGAESGEDLWDGYVRLVGQLEEVSS